MAPAPPTFTLPDPDQPILQPHMPALDVLRGVAISMVLLYHGFWMTQNSQPGRLANLFTRLTYAGWLGVDLFFVLSGFLITGILLDARTSPRFFRNFYARRALRILPAYWLTLALLVAFHFVDRNGFLLALTFLGNTGLLPNAIVFGPLWSLAVEEQFYLLWPLIVRFTSRRTLTGFCTSVSIVEPVLRLLVRLRTGQPVLTHAPAWFLADNLALGALGAVFLRSAYGTRRNTFRLAALLAASALIALGLAASTHVLGRNSLFGAGFQTVPVHMLFLAALLAMLAAPARTFALAPFGPLRHLGYISYSLYLFHVIVFTLFDRLHPQQEEFYAGRFPALLLRFTLCTFVAITLAWLSRTLFERRFLRLKRHFLPESSATTLT